MCVTDYVTYVVVTITRESSFVGSIDVHNTLESTHIETCDGHFRVILLQRCNSMTICSPHQLGEAELCYQSLAD